MPPRGKVLRSINAPDGARCVDVFVRVDGSFGFEEYRRDSEDGRGWFPIGNHGARVYGTAQAALVEARACVPWLDAALLASGGGRPGS